MHKTVNNGKYFICQIMFLKSVPCVNTDKYEYQAQCIVCTELFMQSYSSLPMPRNNFSSRYVFPYIS